MVEKKIFDYLEDNTPVYEYVLTSKKASASIISFGATLKNLFVPSKNGLIDVVLGYDTVKEYQENDGYLGATVGRNSNRLYGRKFEINDTPFKININDRNKSNLHGGIKGFSFQNFSEVKICNKENSVELKWFSKDKEEGFLGNMDFRVKYSLKGSNLTIEYFAVCDKDTVANFTNHAYFNLNGHDKGNCENTMLKINADYYTPINKYLIPNGKLLKVKRTPFNFLKFKPIGKDIDKNHKQLNIMGGYDVNFCLNNNGEFKKVVSCYSKDSLVLMDTYTDLLGLQFYSGNTLSKRKGKGGTIYDLRQGFCLETQASYPDSLNKPHFPSIILPKGKEYYSKTQYNFKVIKEKL